MTDITKKEDVLQELRRLDILPHNTILLAYRGSVAHGMYVPPEEENSTDDVDLMGIVLPSDPYYYFGLKNWGAKGSGTKEIFEGQWDCVYYSLKRLSIFYSSLIPMYFHSSGYQMSST